MRKWMPLEDPIRPDVWTDISNAVSTPRGTYRNAPGFLGSGTAPGTPGTMLSAWQGMLVDGSITHVAGTTTKLYTWSGATFTDRSVGGGYTSSATAWSFVQYGNITIATNGKDAPQFRDATTVNAFANLAGTPPTTAKLVCMQSNAVLFFNTNNGGNHFSTSDIGNYANYTSGEAISDNFIASRAGDITAAVAFRDEVIVFKETSCYRMRYVGLPIIWTVELISDQHGALGPGSVCSAGDYLVVCDYKNGAYVFDGSTFNRADEGIKAFLVQLVFAPNASQYFRSQESAWFEIPTRAFLQYNLRSQSWGRFTATTPNSQSLTSGAHVLVTGSGIYDEMRGATMIDVSDSFPILSSFAEDENATGISSALSGYVTSGLYGKHGRMTGVKRVTPDLKTPDSVVGTTNVPAASAMTLTPFSLTNPEGTPTTEASVACSTGTEKRFDFTITRNWVKCKLAFASTPWELSDVEIKAIDEGESS